ncbi:hypothetical protein BH09ACT8_BH09ACT8_32180 [soil metagenome]
MINSPHVVQLTRRANGAWVEQPEKAPLIPADPLVLRCVVPPYADNTVYLQ